MNIHEISVDPDAWDSLLTPLDLPVDPWWIEQGVRSYLDLVSHFDGTPMKLRWRPVPVVVDPASKRKNRGAPVDFLWCEVARVAVSERALHILWPLVGSEIEALPLECLTHPERRYYVLNFLDRVDCLDEDRADIDRYPDGEIRLIRRYAFKPGATDGHHLFRIEQRPFGDTLASSELKHLVESSGLVGLTFRPVGDAAFDSGPAASPTAASKGRRRPDARGSRRRRS